MTLSTAASRIHRQAGPDDSGVLPSRLASRAMTIAGMGYWVANTCDPETFWISPELADLVGVPSGPIAIKVLRERYEGEGASRVFEGFRTCISTGAP